MWDYTQVMQGIYTTNKLLNNFYYGKNVFLTWICVALQKIQNSASLHKSTFHEGLLTSFHLFTFEPITRWKLTFEK